jgi:hypothetical protein
MPKIKHSPFWQAANGAAALWQGDAADELRAMPAASVHCVVTSPPY